MLKLNFTNDYSEGAHPNILKALSETNYIQQEGYGDDDYCKNAADLIRKELDSPESEIHFVSGGTQANMLCISAFLKPYESVIAAESAHIVVHEAGAIEFTGHKINTYKVENGKLTPKQIKEAVEFHYDEHMVLPKMVFISNTTELGTVYKKAELEAISKSCKEYNLLLYIDGARLGAALVSAENDITLAELNKLVDAYYIGGTKNGALIGEAIVINNPDLKERFRYNMKQKGALIAKGRIIGLQFQALFTDNNYYNLALHANKMAMKLAAGIKSAGFEFISEPQSNQIFPIISNSVIEKLNKQFGFYVWAAFDEKRSIVRLVCSWATQESQVDEFIKCINE